VVLLEDGRGAAGRARLAFGARARYCLPWSTEHVADLAWLARVPTSRRLYGVLSYDLGLPPAARRAGPPITQPLADFFEPEHELVVDLAHDAVVEGDERVIGGPAGRRADRHTAPTHPAHPALLHRSFSQPAYEAAVRTVKDHIAAGDVYQVNLAVAETFQVALSPWEIYLRLRAVNPSPWMGFADFGDWQVVSGSPELLLEIDGPAGRRADGPGGSEERSRHPVAPVAAAVIRTRPIAGTRKKTGDAIRDAAMRAELALDAKEQAEHRMLVDLARNDVGRVAEFGSVRVAAREVVEEYSHVFHLVSEVVGILRADCGVSDAVAAVFPGGTITGAPKIRAMEIIADLEPVARGAYTGGLGWLGPDGGQVNILIRSAVYRGGLASVQAGAGIVWDSDPAREWRESLRKGAAMRLALGCAE
jgi:4-amino-4-deoxychorismate synthase (2-amino-4-deoxychorismate-forming) component I